MNKFTAKKQRKKLKKFRIIVGKLLCLCLLNKKRAESSGFFKKIMIY